MTISQRESTPPLHYRGCSQALRLWDSSTNSLTPRRPANPERNAQHLLEALTTVSTGSVCSIFWYWCSDGSVCVCVRVSAALERYAASSLERPAELESVHSLGVREAELVQVAPERVAEGQSVLGEVLEVGHPVTERGLVRGLVRECEVHVVQPQTRHEQ